MGLNNIAKEGWDYISGLAKNISVEGLQNGWNTYIKQSPEELANVARKTMERKNTILNSNPDLLDEINKVMAGSKNISDKEYSSAVNNIKNNLSNNNTKEANNIAKSIEERFQDGSYIKMLQEAEAKRLNMSETYSTVPARGIENKFKAETKEKLTNNKIINNFTTEKQQEKIADAAYKLQGKKEYFNKPNAPKTNQIRTGVAIGTYMGTMTTARLIHGGTPITNEYGERDIVGIPFI